MRFSRTRAGCLTCRSRRKKCDEVKPRCAGCRRNQLPCDWPPSTGSEDHDSASSSTPTSSSTQIVRQRIQASSSIAVTRRQVSSPASIPWSVSAVHIGAENDTRACMLTPQSVNLLSHFLVHTATCFAMGPLDGNPFVTVFVPLASTDDLLMHSLLALSGAHLSSKEPENIELARAADMHYSKLLHGLRREFSTLQEEDLRKKERLLRLLMVACHYEVSSPPPLYNRAYGVLTSHLAQGCFRKPPWGFVQPPTRESSSSHVTGRI